MSGLERWRRVLELVEEALVRDGDARTAFLHRALSHDEDLRSEVEALLAEDRRDGPLDHPLADHLGTLAETLMDPPRGSKTDAATGPGDTLGRFEVVR